jgi:hypothetical protein
MNAPPSAPAETAEAKLRMKVRAKAQARRAKRPRGVNRHLARVQEKAVRCMKRGTKIPGGIVMSLRPEAIERLAARNKFSLKIEARNGYFGLFASPVARAVAA